MAFLLRLCEARSSFKSTACRLFIAHTKNLFHCPLLTGRSDSEHVFSEHITDRAALHTAMCTSDAAVQLNMPKPAKPLALTQDKAGADMNRVGGPINHLFADGLGTMIGDATKGESSVATVQAMLLSQLMFFSMTLKCDSLRHNNGKAFLLLCALFSAQCPFKLLGSWLGGESNRASTEAHAC